MGLTPKQSLFVTEYLVDLNATQAAVRAGYSRKTAEGQGSRLLRNAQVRKAVAEGKAERAKRVELTADEVIQELRRIARADLSRAYGPDGNFLPLHEMPEDTRRALAGIEVEELYDGHGRDRVNIGRLHKVKFWDKVRALELLAKHLGLLVDKVKVEVDGSFAELLKQARERAERR